jgi:hypothetical protein
MIKYMLEGVLGRRVTVFAEDIHGIMTTLIGCVFSPTYTFNDMIRQEEFLHHKAMIIERIFIGDHVNSKSVYKSLSVQIRFDDKSVRDSLNRNDKLTMSRIINESFQIEFDKFSYAISCSNDHAIVNIAGTNSNVEAYMIRFWCLFDLIFIFLGYCLIAKSFDFTKEQLQLSRPMT